MRVIVALGCLLLASAGPIPDDKCFSFNGRYYDKEVLKSDIENADAFSYLPSKNTIYFSYTLPESESQSDDAFTTAYLNLDTKEFRKISGIKGGFATASDREHDEVYVAGENGVYKFNQENDSVEFVSGMGKDIWTLYFGEKIYYVTYPEYKLYGPDDRLVYKDPEIKTLRMGGNAYMYFVTNSSGLFRYTTYEPDHSEFYEPPVEGYDYKGLATDGSCRVYAFGLDGVYFPNLAKKTLDKIASFDHLNGLVFVKDGIVYSTDNSIVKLTPSKAKCSTAA